jgi:hypothetical protein
MGLRVLQAAQRSLVARCIVAAAVLVGGVVGATVAGALGAAGGLAVANGIGTAIWWYSFAAVDRATVRRPAREGTATLNNV